MVTKNALFTGGREEEDVTKGKIDLEIQKVRTQIAELKQRHNEQKEALANEFKERLLILQTREKDLRQKRKIADDMEKQKITQNLSVEELQRLVAKHEAENRQIIKNAQKEMEKDGIREKEGNSAEHGETAETGDGEETKTGTGTGIRTEGLLA